MWSVKGANKAVFGGSETECRARFAYLSFRAAFEVSLINDKGEVVDSHTPPRCKCGVRLDRREFNKGEGLCALCRK